MIDRQMIRPAVHRYVDLTAGPVTIPVPSGETWIIYNFRPVTITWPLNAVLAIGEKVMFWSPDNTQFTPMGSIETACSLWDMRLLSKSLDKQLPIIADGGQNIVVYSEDNTGHLYLDWIVVDKAKGLDRFTPGGRDAKRRMIFTWGYQAFTVTNGTAPYCYIVNSANVPGQTTWPWGDPVPPDRRYWLLAFVQPLTQDLAVAAAITDVVVYHEGRAILTQPLILTLPATLSDILNGGAQNQVTIFPEPYGIDSNEILQVAYQITQGGAVPAQSNLYCGFLAIEEFMSGDAEPTGVA